MRYLPFLLLLLSCQTMPEIDYQGHRGCRGLYPENTLPAFLHALEYPAVTTLEMDVVITADGTVLVSHDPWLEPEICLDLDGALLDSSEASRRSILALRIDEVQAYDCGSKPHPRFPEQRKMVGKKPRLQQVFAAVEEYCTQHDRPLPNYNIELKYLPEWEAAGFVPSEEDFVEAVLTEVSNAGLTDRVILQCFHPPILAKIRAENPAVTLAYLDEFPQNGSLEAKMEALGFVPPIYSPYHLPLTQKVIDQAKVMGMKVIPWTVNETERMEELVTMGVAGIITDYPNRIPASKP